jgi:hypothetical protein
MNEQVQPPEATNGVTQDPSDNTTLTAVIDGYRDNGFASEFSPLDGSVIRCETCESEVAAGKFTIHSLRRLEGASDPDDMVAVVAITCPVCAAQGTLVLGYGPIASREESDILSALRDGRMDDPLPPNASPADIAEERDTPKRRSPRFAPMTAPTIATKPPTSSRP